MSLPAQENSRGTSKTCLVQSLCYEVNPLIYTFALFQKLLGQVYRMGHSRWYVVFVCRWRRLSHIPHDNTIPTTVKPSWPINKAQMPGRTQTYLVMHSSLESIEH